MVSELHRMGFQRLRIMPYQHPLAWRLAVGMRDMFATENGIVIPDGHFHAEDLAIYSSASGNEYFEWKDAKTDTARKLAEKFLDRFGWLAAHGEERDWEYAGWLSELIGVLEREHRLPVLPECLYLSPFEKLTQVPLRDYITNMGDRYFDLPPPGGLLWTARAHAKIPVNQLVEVYSGQEGAESLVDFQVVAKLLGLAMAAGVRKWEHPKDDHAGEEYLDQAVAAFVTDRQYTRSPAWHSREALGERLIVAFDLDHGWCRDEDFGFVVRFALDDLAAAAAALLTSFSEDGEATWDDHGHPRMNELHAFATCAFLGTESDLYPGRSLGSFQWRPVASPPASLS